jgi:outer membrane receptor protein involved in Fe transport
LGVRIVANRTGSYISAFTASSFGRNLHVLERTIVNAGIAYQYRPWLNFSIDVGNLFNEPQAFYRGIPDQMQSTIVPGTTITFGVSGRF